MKFIFLIIVMLTQFALQMGTSWSASTSYNQEGNSQGIATTKEEPETPIKKVKKDSKKNEK
ncbi:hypothetical protein [Myroides odoratus]|uniref:hypothetical protein n=1 Tax=Myroides odoratus TaxID=256 RepID=UPI000AA141B9|nr:hypothetical protein [Myroides odoratus]